VVKREAGVEGVMRSWTGGKGVGAGSGVFFNLPYQPPLPGEVNRKSFSVFGARFVLRFLGLRTELGASRICEAARIIVTGWSLALE